MIKAYDKYAMLLEINGVNSYEVSQATGINYSALSGWKNGKSRIKTDKLCAIAEYFGVGTGYFKDEDTADRYDLIKDYVFISACNAARNQDMLAHAPHETLLDLALVYNLDMGIGNDIGIRKGMVTGNKPDRSILITASHLKSLGIDEHTLKAAAWENTKRIRPASLGPIGSFLPKVVPAEALSEAVRENVYGNHDFPAYYLTSRNYYQGAVYMFDSEIMDMAAAALQGNLIVLPYSAHMVFLLKDIPTADDLLAEASVRLNQTEPEAGDFLSSNAYRYNAESGILSIAGNSQILSPDKYH